MNPFLKKYFLETKNIGKIKKADKIIEYKSSNCSDNLRIYLKLSDNKIVDIKYKVFGCWGVITGAAITSEMIKGLTIEEIFSLEEKVLLNQCKDYDKEKEKCILIMLNLLKNNL